MRHHPHQEYPFPLIKGLDGNDWGMPFAHGGHDDPVWRLTGGVPRAVADLETRGFHAPRHFGRHLTGTSDSPFVVMDRVRGITVYGFRATVVGRHKIHVQDAGYFVHKSNGLDRRDPLSNSKRNSRSRGIISDAMVIRRDRLEYAIAHGTGLGHVLHLCFVETNTKAGFCHPMVGCERGKSGWGAEGRRIAIHPHIDLTRRDLSPAGLAIARTLQTHGCYIGDNAGSGSCFKAHQATRHHNPWEGLDFHKKSLHGIRWDDFVVLPKGWQ